MMEGSLVMLHDILEHHDHGTAMTVVFFFFPEFVTLGYLKS